MTLAIQRDPQTLAAAASAKLDLVGALFGGLAVAAARAVAPVPSPVVGIPEGANVVGVGYGAKSTLGAAIADQPAIRVYVRTKLPRAALTAAEMVPADVGGTPTDVVAVGDVVAQAVQCGASCGHYLITAGTLGCLVRRNADPSASPYILSNNHVLANSNAAAIGDRILQPGPHDGGVLRIAGLSGFVPIDFTGQPNYVDAAIARLDDPKSVDPDVIGIGRVAPPTMRAALYQSVRKWGRTTNHTVGVVVDLSADIRVGFGTRVARFDDQLAVEGVSARPFSQGGDSGSLVVDAVQRRAVGLLFAGGGGVTFVNPIDAVLEHPSLGLSIL